MLYGATIWANTSTGNVNKILKLQKRAARIILEADAWCNSVALFQQLNLLNSADISAYTPNHVNDDEYTRPARVAKHSQDELTRPPRSTG